MSSSNLKTGQSNASLDKSIIAPPSIVFKMAKKIAQLTKVVYFLHSRTEDHEDDLDYLTEKIQEHVKSINDNARVQISDLTSKAEEGRILVKAHEEMIAVILSFHSYRPTWNGLIIWKV